MENSRPEQLHEENDIVERLRQFAHEVISIAMKRGVSPPPVAVRIVEAAAAEFDQAQRRRLIDSEDARYWRAVINKEYNEAIDKQYGPRPMPPGGIPLPPSPLDRRSQKWFDAIS